MITKQKLKKSILSIRDKLSLEEINSFSDLIFEKVFNLDAYKKAKTVFVYNSFKSEVSTQKAITKMLQSKIVYMPKINENDIMTAVKITQQTEFTINKFGIYQPNNGEIANKNEIDMCIVPGAVFDIHGGRAGYGKAYYDIFLRGTNIYKTAVCYDFQLIDYIPVDLLDVDMDTIVTEKRLLIFKD